MAEILCPLTGESGRTKKQGTLESFARPGFQREVLFAAGMSLVPHYSSLS
jgi:hypothetical protein